MKRSIDPKIWIVSPQDNVGTVIGNEASAPAALPLIGAVTGSIDLKSTVPHGHKVALKAMPRGADIVKYGVVIGRLIHPVGAGEHVHTHNLESLRGRGDL